MTKSVPVHLAWLLAPMLLAACGGDECVLGEKRCRDNVAERCDHEYSDSSAPLVWHQEDCKDGACKVGGDRPFCAMSREPDARCESGETACDGAALVRCMGGFATSATDCISGESTSPSGRVPDVEPAGHCVTSAQYSLCATEPEPSELCPSDAHSSCDQNELLSCQGGFVTRRTDCGSLYCAVTPGYAQCMRAPEPDPLCPLQAAYAVVCDGASVVECHYGYRGVEQPCETGTSCIQGESGAFCVED